jgi:hypothetical protein
VINVNRYKIEAPVRSFTGESVGVHFDRGTGFVDDSTKDGRAAIEYFRRQGYAVARVEDEAAAEASVPAPVDDMTNLGHGAAPSVGLGIGIPDVKPDVPTVPEDGPGPVEDGEAFDPEQHSVEEVLNHLDSTTDEDEKARVLRAEQQGKARKTILARGEQKQGDEQ